MQIISRCIQDIIKYWNECWWMIGLVVISVCVAAVMIQLYRKKQGMECLAMSAFCYRLFVYSCNSVYLFYSFYVTFGMRYVGMRREVKWIPFEGIWTRPWEIPLLIENVLLFVPFGVLLPVTFSKIRSWKIVLTSAGLYSILIEVLQYVFRCGKSEVDDCILNCLGAMIGYGLFLGVTYVKLLIRKRL